MSNESIDRRRFLGQVALGMAGAAALSEVAAAATTPATPAKPAAPAAAATPAKPAAPALPEVTDKHPLVKPLGYVADASKVDAKKNPTYKPGQVCAGCAQYPDANAKPLGKCNLFPGVSVRANGWCRSFVARKK